MAQTNIFSPAFLFKFAPLAILLTYIFAMPFIHKNILISGKVQGVYFRASAKHKADELGIKGFVSNKPDGKVYSEAEGDNPIIERFIEWCRQGPVAAHVTNVEITEGHPKNFPDFRIIR